jgi:hypothetical protein
MNLHNITANFLENVQSINCDDSIIQIPYPASFFADEQTENGKIKLVSLVDESQHAGFRERGGAVSAVQRAARPRRGARTPTVM